MKDVVTTVAVIVYVFLVAILLQAGAVIVAVALPLVHPRVGRVMAVEGHVILLDWHILQLIHGVMGDVATILVTLLIQILVAEVIQT